MPQDIFDQIGTRKRRDIFDDIGGELSDSNPSVASESGGTHYVPAEFQQFAEQAAIEQNEGNYQVPEWLREVVPQAIKFPAKVAIAGGAMQTGRLHWPTDEEVETPLLSPEISRGILAVSSGGLTEMARAAQSRYPQNTLAQVAGGVTEGATDAVSGFSTPENLALLPIAPGGKLAQRAIAGAFLGQAISGTPEQWEAFNNAPELADKIRIATSMGLSYGLPALGVAHSLRKPAKVVEPVKTTQEARNDVPSASGELHASNLSDSVQSERPSDVSSPISRESASGLDQPLISTTPENLRPQKESISPAVEEARPIKFSYVTKEGRDSTLEALPGEALEALAAIRETGGQVDAINGRIVGKRTAEELIQENQPIQPGVESALAEIQRRNAPAEFRNNPEEYSAALLSDIPKGKPGVSKETLDGQTAYVFRNDNGKAVGVAKVDKDTLTDIAVSPKQRKLGIASKLVEAAQNEGIKYAKGPFTPESAALNKKFGLTERPKPIGLADTLRRDTPERSNQSVRSAEFLETASESLRLEPPPVSRVLEATSETSTPKSRQSLGASRGSQSESTATSTRNATTFAEREKLGLPEAEQAARRDFGTVWDEAEALAKADREAPRKLVDSLFVFDDSGRRVAENPRALTDKENALLLRRQIEVQNEHSKAVDTLNAAPDDPVAIQALETARRELQTVYDATKAAGTETGRGLNARKMLANQDFTLARMEAETRAVANNGRPLNAKQAAEVKTLWERINKAESRIAEYEAMADFRKSVQVARQAKVKPFSAVAFLEEKAAAARERIMARRGKLYADPLGVTNVAHLADEAIIGAAHIAKGLRNFKEWSAAMLKDFGDGIKPYLKALFAKSQGLHSEAARLSAAKSRTVTETVKTMSRIGAKDFESRPIEPVIPDKELMALRGNLQRAKDIYFQRLVEAKERNRPLISKVARGALKTINTSRALKTSGDISAVGRQGGWIGAGHPLLAARNIKPMFEAMRSAEGQYRIEQEIKAHPDYARAKQAKLELTEISDTSHMTKAEEAYMNSWADKIPGVAGSQRAYVTYLNKLRMDTFGQLVRDLSKTGKVTAQEARVLANYVNVATGRGYVGKWAGAFAGLNHVFFAPRYVLSRFQLLLGQPLVHQAGKASPRVRALIAKEYARSLAGTATVIGLGVAAGATFNATDPRSSDFLKLKFGNSRLDPLYGLQQTTVFLSRAGYNILRASRHGKVPFKERDVAQRFVRSKLSPVYGSGLNLAMGSDYLGQPTTPAKEALNMIDPIWREDIIKAFEEQGIAKGAGLSMMSLLGMGLQTYEKGKGPKRPKTLSEAMADLREGKIKEFLTGK